MSDRYSHLRRPSGRRYISHSNSGPGNRSVDGSGDENSFQSSTPDSLSSMSQGKTGQMQGLLGEFKVLYEGKLKKLDDADKTGEETTKMRVRVLQAYVNDLCEQNEVLVQTVEELEREANDRVGDLEEKLHRSGKEYQAKCHELERELRNLSTEKTRADTLVEDIKHRLIRQEETTVQLRQQNSNLTHDVDQLISVIQTAKLSGKWEIDKIRFRDLTVEQVFGSSQETYSKIHASDSSSDLKEQIRQRDDKIEALQQELRWLRSDSRTVGGELVSDPSELSASKLKSDLTKLEHRVEDLKYEIQSRDHKISSLTAQINDLEAELSVKNSESSNYMQTIKMLQDKGRHTVIESSSSEDVVRQLKSEIVSMREQHTKSAQNVSYFERRICALEGELVECKEHRRKNLDEIGALQEKLREGQLSTHDHHEVLKSELGRRDDMIQKLRRDVLNLQEKRDSVLAEVHRMEKRNKALEDEIIHVRGQINEADEEVKTANKKVTKLEGELQFLRGQNDESQGQASEQREIILQLKNEKRDIEEKLQEALSSVQQKEELIKQMKDEIKLTVTKTLETQSKLEETAREHQQLHSRYTAQIKEIDRLQTEIQEKELTASQKETMYRSDMADREEETCRLKIDLNSLHEKLAQSDGQLFSREEHISHLQSQLRESVTEVTTKEEELQRLESELLSANDDRRRLGELLQRREISLQQLEHDLDRAKEKYKDTIEENGRLEARVQAFAINAQSEQDVLSTEVKRKDEGLMRLKMDIVKLQEVCSRYEEKASQAEREAENLKLQLRSCQNENETRRAAVKNLETNVEELKDRNKKQVEDNNRMEDKVRELTIAITTQEAQCEKLKQMVTAKEDLIQKLHEDSESLSRQQKEAINKVLIRDENMQKLNVEIGRFKAKNQEKTKELMDLTIEIAKQSELIKKLQTTLSQNHHDLDELRRRSEQELLRKEETIKHIQEDLLESQTQHSACYNELVKIEEEFDVLKADHSQLSKVNQVSSMEIASLHDQIHQLELDLTITQEKHRTCQKEVSSRDQVILRLQADLDTAQQNYSGSLEELKISEAELKRLSGKLKQLQQEIRENHDSIDSKDNQITEYEKKIQQLQHDEEMALQETSWKNYTETQRR
uniref:Uncharacterized protein n=1 Tax=Arion vulgaris TaxID=1028688 RepID=A0A0B7AUF6_9EUPU